MTVRHLALRRAEQGPRRRRLDATRREAIIGYLFLLPWAIGFVAFIAGPTFASLGLSFTNYDLLSPPAFIGIANYQRLLFSDPLFWQSLVHTGHYALIFVPGAVLGALLLAVYLNQRVRGTSIFRAAFFAPSLVPAAGVAVIWIWLLDPAHGLVNGALGHFGVEGPGWLTSSGWVVPGLALISLWGAVGGNTMLIFLAALQGVETDLKDAAKVDGARWWGQFRHVTFPAISPAVFFNMTLSIIAAFQVFTLAFVATGGGPAYASLFYSLYIYQQAFQNLNMGYASALAWILLLIVIGLTWIQFKLSSRWVYYQGGA
jgi:multiple sugar transport system permease protein